VVGCGALFDEGAVEHRSLANSGAEFAVEEVTGEDVVRVCAAGGVDVDVEKDRALDPLEAAEVDFFAGDADEAFGSDDLAVFGTEVDGTDLVGAVFGGGKGFARVVGGDDDAFAGCFEALGGEVGECDADVKGEDDGLVLLLCRGEWGEEEGGGGRDEAVEVHVGIVWLAF